MTIVLLMNWVVNAPLVIDEAEKGAHASSLTGGWALFRGSDPIFELDVTQSGHTDIEIRLYRLKPIEKGLSKVLLANVVTSLKPSKNGNYFLLNGEMIHVFVQKGFLEVKAKAVELAGSNVDLSGRWTRVETTK